MKIIVSPDSFKGTLTSAEAASAIEKGILKAMPEAEVVCLPLGDGGEGTAEAIAAALPFSRKIECRECRDSLGRPLATSYFNLGRSTALIESAAANGLTLIQPSLRDIMKADTSGTGLLIADALGRGFRHFIICMGGTATCDAGYGAFKEMRRHDFSGTDFTLLCDVENPLCGTEGAAIVFGPQKGARPEEIPILDNRNRKTALDIYGWTAHDALHRKYGGAAGGLAAMLMACYGAKPVAGIKKVLEIIGFQRHLEDAALVITGEGSVDATTLNGKAPVGVLMEAVQANIPVAVIGGRVKDKRALSRAGFSYIIQATPDNPDPKISSAEYLTEATENFINYHILKLNSETKKYETH